MKTTHLNNWLFRLLNLAVPLLTIYVFWLINAPYRLPLPPRPDGDLIDLMVISIVTLLACCLVWIIDQQSSASVSNKIGQSVLGFAVLAPSSGWLLYSGLFHLPFFQTPFLSIDLPLGLPVFVAWASTYLLRQHLYRIEAQNRAVWKDSPGKKKIPSLGKSHLSPVAATIAASSKH